VVKAAEDGRIGVKAWYSISLLPQADQAGLLEMHLSGMPATQIAELSRKARKPSNGATAKLSRVKIAMPQGAAVVVSGSALSMPAVVELLAETLKEARKAAEQYDVKTFQSMMKDKAGG
jgi:hypothetical protein